VCVVHQSNLALLLGGSRPARLSATAGAVDAGRRHTLVS
jgi:hypothetical protein